MIASVRRVFLSRLAIEIYLLLAAIGLGFWWHSWRARQAAVVSVPVVAQDTRPARKWRRHPVERTVQQPTLSAAEIERLVARYARPGLRPAPAPAGSTAPPSAPLTPIAELEDRREMPAGADVLVTLDAEGTVEATIIPRPISFIGMPFQWHLFAEGLTQDRNLSRYSIRLGAEMDVFRIGRVHLEPRAELFRDSLPLEIGGYDDGVRVGVRVGWN